MKQKPELTEEENLTLEAFKDLSPFTITVIKPEDALFLSTALLRFVCNGNEKISNKMLMGMANLAQSVGVESAVSECFDIGKDEGHEFPEFIKPIFIHMLGHIIEKYKDSK